MDEQKLLEDLGESYGYLKLYVEKRVELAKLEAREKYALGLSFVITLTLLGTVAAFVIGLLTLALGFYLSEQLNSSTQAFLLLAGGYFLFGLLVIAFRKPLIQNPLLAQAIKSLDD